MKIIEDVYSIKVPIYPQVLDQTWLEVMNNQFKRVMLQQVGKVWYDKNNTNQQLCLKKMQLFVGKE